MRTSRDTIALSYPLRLPDEIQAAALSLLDISREVINFTITALWKRLDEFSTRTNTYAYKQVEEMFPPPVVHGHRQWRCEAEQAGRILRGQAERKQQFTAILPLLSQGMIQPKTDTKPAGKNRKAIKEALVEVRGTNSDGGNAVAFQSLIEQACNWYLQNGCFPDTYEEMQPIPVLKAGVLPYAGDDAMREVLHLAWVATYPNEVYGITEEDIEARFREHPETTEERQERQRRYICTPPFHSWVALEGTNLIGLCTIKQDEHENLVQALYVLPDYQNKGVGKRRSAGLERKKR